MSTDNRIVYFDNAATSFPKPPEVIDAVVRYLTRTGANPGRSGHKLAVEAGRIVFNTRQKLAALFGISNPMHVIFTANATSALNLAIQGIARPGDHFITTSMEHNSTIRPLRELQKKGLITLTIVRANKLGLIDPDIIARAFRKTTRACVINHASNLTGIVQPLQNITTICKQNDILTIIDAAQSAGTIPLNLQTDKIDLLGLAGHKGLFGPTGTGALLISDNFDYREMNPLMYGGTGSKSNQIEQPDFLPDIFESGTMNVAGIAGLEAGLDFLSNYPGGLKALHQHKIDLTEHFIKLASQKVPGFEYFTAIELLHTGIAAFRLEHKSVSDTARLLSDKYGIMSRAGLHCTPLAHQTIGTFPEGLLRFSFGYSNTATEVEHSIMALQKIAGVRS